VHVDTQHARRVLDFQQVRNVPLSAVLERYGILGDLKKIGAQHFGTCPIHKGTNRKQFVCDLSSGKNVWRCFGDCDRGGSTIELVAALEGVDTRAAAELIAEWFAIVSRQSAHHRKPKEKAMSSNKPTHTVHSAQKRGEGEKDILTRIGSAWPFQTKDGRSGLSIQLSALPVGDRMVIFEADPDDEETDKKSAKRK
jgi:hypothetical protein